jgi:Tol biopolymer transport system component
MGGVYTLNPDGTGRAKLEPTHAVSSTSDGCRLAFTRYSGDLVVTDADGSNARVVAVGASGMEEHPRFSPDGSRIVFVSRRNVLMVVDPDGSHSAQLTQQVYAFHPTWSPDGSKILFGSSGRPQRIRVMNADGTDLRDLGGGSAPQWSPDGGRIVFVATTNDSAGHVKSAIAVMRADGTQLTTLTNGSRFALRPSWSPDGTQIAFESMGNDGVYLDIMNSDGTHRTTLADQLMIKLGSDDAAIAWSPDGSRIAFTRMAAPVTDPAKGLSTDVFVVGRNGGSPSRVTSTGKDMVAGWFPTCTRQ